MPTSIASVLDWLHSGQALNGDPVVHGDITPANVVIDENDQAVLVDWGLVRVARHVTGNVRRTPYYCAPEVEKRGEYSPASDRYAFGCLAYFVLTGAPPPIDPQQRRAGLATIAGVDGQPASVDELARIFAHDADARPTAGEWLRALRLQTTTAPVRSSPMPPLAPGANPSAPDQTGVRRVTVGLDENGKVVSAEPYRGRRLAWIAAATSAAAVAALFLTIGPASAWFGTPETDPSADDGSTGQALPSEPSPRQSHPSPGQFSEVPTSSWEEDPTESTAEWTVLHGPAELLRIPQAGVFGEGVVDLDELVVESNTSEDEGDGTDIVYDYYEDNLERGSESYVGEGPNTQPDPEACAAEARSRAIGLLEADDVEVGETFLCIVTTEDNVAWLELVEKDDTDWHVDLVFEAIVWASQAD